jgi:hypothetical protein
VIVGAALEAPAVVAGLDDVGAALQYGVPNLTSNSFAFKALLRPRTGAVASRRSCATTLAISVTQRWVVRVGPPDE